jgi:hypothetical protein
MIDTTFPHKSHQAPSAPEITYRLRIAHGEESTIVLLTAPTLNTRNNIMALVTQIARDQALDPTHTVWIEHCLEDSPDDDPQEIFFRLIFLQWDGDQPGDPEPLDITRQHVERLIGLYWCRHCRWEEWALDLDGSDLEVCPCCDQPTVSHIVGDTPETQIVAAAVQARSRGFKNGAWKDTILDVLSDLEQAQQGQAQGG